MKSETRKKQILSEAARLFSRYGYDRVTIKQLAWACDITEPALYRYFSSKEDIYTVVLETLVSDQDHEGFFERLKSESDLGVILPAIARHIMEYFEAHKDFYRLLLDSTLRGHERSRRLFRAVRNPYVEFLKDQLDRLHAEGKIRSKNNELTARCFVGSVFDCALNAAIWKGFQGKSYSSKEIIDNNIPIFINGLSI